ncbi:DUF3786 domain-containing protein [Desulfatiglans anilini]|uniref:DUF3786 domain-containing protein n=1 Tax=Desulfatiglans anilini TaxID=90728 RepID=UPI00041837EB|nr:DUF3786 domain-containing protein [Desulfatiglans anilini]
MEKSDIFDEIYRTYLAGVSSIDLKEAQKRLGIEAAEGVIRIPFFGGVYRVSSEGITDPSGHRPRHLVSVILCQYLLLCPQEEPTDSEWVTYKDFKDAAPFVGGFRTNAENPIAALFAGRLPELEGAARSLTGRPVDIGIASDIALRFDALPKIPLLMLFNDRDEDFAAQCTLLFERRAESYLDMECLAMIGWALADGLNQIAKQ